MKSNIILALIVALTLSMASCRKIIDKIKGEPEIEAEYYTEAYEVKEKDVIDPNDDDAYEKYRKAVAKYEDEEEEAIPEPPTPKSKGKSSKGKSPKDTGKSSKGTGKSSNDTGNDTGRSKTSKAKSTKTTPAQPVATGLSSAEIDRLLNEMEYHNKSLRILNNDPYENRNAIANIKSQMTQITNKLDNNSSSLSSQQKKRYKNLNSDYKKLK